MPPDEDIIRRAAEVAAERNGRVLMHTGTMVMVLVRPRMVCPKARDESLHRTGGLSAPFWWFRHLLDRLTIGYVVIQRDPQTGNILEIELRASWSMWRELTA